jgi:hypothetical protein
MKTYFNKWLHTVSVCVLLIVVVSSCTKAKLDDKFVSADPPPIGDWTSSDDISPENLVAHFAFEGNPNDEKGNVTGGTLSGNGSYVEGIKGKAYQGGTNAFIGYSNPGPLANLTSFTVSMWINTEKHDGGAQGVFGLGRADGSFWGNFFMLIEGNTDPGDTMQIKMHFEKTTVPNVEHWIDPEKKYRVTNMYSKWKQFVGTYDETTSTFSWYVNSERKDLPDDVAVQTADGTNPLGPLAFKAATKFIIGGYQNHLGAPFGAPETWMLNYTGKLDEFRIYKKALSQKEIKALFIYERQGL